MLRLALAGEVDLADLGVVQRLVLLRARYGHDRALGPLIREASDAMIRTRELADEEADRAFLNGLIDGTGDLLSEDTFPRMEPLFAKYPEGSEMFALVERAATVFGDAVQEVACWVLAGVVIDEVRRSSHEGWD